MTELPPVRPVQATGFSRAARYSRRMITNWPNPVASGNGAVTPLFNAGRPGRAVPEFLS